MVYLYKRDFSEQNEKVYDFVAEFKDELEACDYALWEEPTHTEEHFAPFDMYMGKRIIIE